MKTESTKENLIIISEENMVDQLNTAVANNNGGSGSGSGSGSSSGNTTDIIGLKNESVQIDLGQNFGTQTINCNISLVGTTTNNDDSSGSSSGTPIYTINSNKSLIIATLGESIKTNTVYNDEQKLIVITYLCLGGNGQCNITTTTLPINYLFSLSFKVRREIYEDNYKAFEENIEIEVSGQISSSVSGQIINISTNNMRAIVKD